MDPTESPTADRTAEHPLAPSGFYCSPDTPIRFVAGILVVAVVVASALLLTACGHGRVQAPACSPLTAQATCR